MLHPHFSVNMIYKFHLTYCSTALIECNYLGACFLHYWQTHCTLASEVNKHRQVNKQKTGQFTLKWKKTRCKMITTGKFPSLCGLLEVQPLIVTSSTRLGAGLPLFKGIRWRKKWCSIPLFTTPGDSTSGAAGPGYPECDKHRCVLSPSVLFFPHLKYLFNVGNKLHSSPVSCNNSSSSSRWIIVIL